MTANARVIRDGAIIYNGKINTIFREKNQAKQVSCRTRMWYNS